MSCADRQDGGPSACRPRAGAESQSTPHSRQPHPPNRACSRPCPRATCPVSAAGSAATRLSCRSDRAAGPAHRRDRRARRRSSARPSPSAPPTRAPVRRHCPGRRFRARCGLAARLRRRVRRGWRRRAGTRNGSSPEARHRSWWGRHQPNSPWRYQLRSPVAASTRRRGGTARSVRRCRPRPENSRAPPRPRRRAATIRRECAPDHLRPPPHGPARAR